MVELYLIVHPKCFNNWDIDGTLGEKKKKLEELMRENVYLIIDEEFSEFGEEIHLDMPPPHKDLRVTIIGAYYKSKTTRNWCLDNQFETLKDRGYNVEINKQLSLPDIT